MFTTSHGIIGYLVYQKNSRKAQLCAVIGSMLPDLSMILSLAYLYVVRIAFGDANYEMVHAQQHALGWVNFTGNLLHAYLLYMILIGISYMRKMPLVRAFGVGGLLHAMIDFFTHQGDYTWNHFYPFDVAPIEGLLNYYTPTFFILIHALWALIFIPRLWLYFRRPTTVSVKEVDL